jgi:hypothetical protein
MTFARLTWGDVVAAVAALALLLVLSVDWYTTTEGRDLRRIEQNTNPQGAQAGEVGRFADREADRIATNAEQTAWQADESIDRLILVVLLSAALLATAAAWLRAADVRFNPPWTPSAFAAMVGLVGALLIAFRIVQKPANDAAAVVKIGAPLGLACVGVLVLGARAAWRAESEPADGEAAPASKPEPVLAGVGAAPTTPLWSEDEPESAELVDGDDWFRKQDTDEQDAIQLGTSEADAVQAELRPDGPGRTPAARKRRSSSSKRKNQTRRKKR